MSQSEANSSALSIPILTRTQVAEQIMNRLAGRIADTRLSGWAFDHFYRLELGEEQPESGYEELLEHVLDELMFADDPQFRMDDSALRALVTRLGEV